MKRVQLFGVVSAALLCLTVASAEDDTFKPLGTGPAPDSFEQLWGGFDPAAEPLETEVLKEWQEGETVLRVVRFRVGVFKGKVARVAAIYGFPKGKQNLPGLVQLHGGGQYADQNACIANARRGYATVSVAWAGRISASQYRVTPDVVRLFWEGKTADPAYKITTDWGAVDGYHAPSRNPGNQFPSIRPAQWTLDAIESPRNSGWFLCAVAARRALTFLQDQPEVDADRLGVYGHSMGGKLTVMTAWDSRVKAAAPSCGGISDRYSDSPLFRRTLGDDVYLKQIRCPIVFLSPSNDFHGRIGDLPKAVREIQSSDWRVTCSPHHNHQDTPEYEAATMVWFDAHLQKSSAVPKIPQTSLLLNSESGVPRMTVAVDTSLPVQSIDVYYTQHGKPNETPQDREDSMSRFWRHAAVKADGSAWVAELPLIHDDRPLWAFANVLYKLDKKVSGAGYYYRMYETQNVNLSSLLLMSSPEELRDAGVRATLRPIPVIEDFRGDWQKEWFTYRPEDWGRSTYKLRDAQYHPFPNARMQVQVQSQQPNSLVVRLDEFAAVIQLPGGDAGHSVILTPADFTDYGGTALASYKGVRRLTLSASETLRPGRGQTGQPLQKGGRWSGPAPVFRKLAWVH